MTELVWAFLLILAFFGVGMAALFVRLYRKVEQGKALLVSTLRDVDVTFTGRVVLPVVHKAEVMDISVKTIEIDRSGGDGLICQDNIRADIKVTFFVRVNKTKDDVTKVAQTIGCARASDQQTLEALFSAKFSEALKTVGKQLDFTDLYTMRHEFRDRIIEVIGTDLNGYVLEDCAIDYLEQTPLGRPQGRQHPGRAGHPQDHRADSAGARAHQRAAQQRAQGHHQAGRGGGGGHPGAGAPEGRGGGPAAAGDGVGAGPGAVRDR